MYSAIIMIDTIKTILGFVIVSVLILGISIGGFFIKRWWNYTWSYESQVRVTICELVHEDSLKDSSYCD